MIPHDPSPWTDESLPGWLRGAVILAAVAVTALIVWGLASGADLPKMPGARP